MHSLLRLTAFLAAMTFPIHSLFAADPSGKFILTCLNIPDIQRGAGLSLVLQLPNGKTCLYDTGSGYPDATSPDGWQGQFNTGRDLLLPFKCDVLVAPGHGLHAPHQFAEATRPEVTLCSVFPRYARGLAARKIFAAVGSKVYVTGLNGQLQVVSDGNGYTVTAEREETPPAK